MASTTTVILTDDVDGKKADETVRFSLDGAQYEIDLSKKNAAALRRALSEYVAAGRRVQVLAMLSRADPAPPPDARHGDPSSRLENATIRHWAEQAGLAVSNRGPISTNVVDQYHTAHTESR
jgi:hypothetical protein